MNIESSLRSNINSELTAELANKLKEVPNQLSSLSDGLYRLTDGAGQLKSGSAVLSDGLTNLQTGAETFSKKMSEFSVGTDSAFCGSTDLYNGITALQSGLEKLDQGSSLLDSSVIKLDSGITQLADSADKFNDSIIAYTGGVDQLIAQVEGTGTFLTGYVTTHPALMADESFQSFMTKLGSAENTKKISLLKESSEKLKTASAQISGALTVLTDKTSGVPALKQGVTDLKAGIDKALTASGQIVTGSNNLNNGIHSLAEGALQLKDGATSIASGAVKTSKGAFDIENGITELKNGLDTAAAGVSVSLNDAAKQTKTLDGLDTYAKNPVITKTEPVEPVPNYGTAFAPYFMSLSLWVGALIIFFGLYYDPEGKFKLLSRNSDYKLLRSFGYLLISLVQAVVLGTVLRLCLGLTVKHLFFYYFACCFVSIVFIAIVQFLLVVLKDIGKFLTIAFLILQLTSCGGTFPMETVPPFFRVINPFMPMTYSVSLFKEAVSGGSLASTPGHIGILAVIFAVFLVATVLFSITKSNKNTEKIAL